MVRGFTLAALATLLMAGDWTSAHGEAEAVFDFTAPPHHYWKRQPRDVCTALAAKVANGEVKLDTSSEKAFARSVLDALDVPVSSQMLVYSATSLQSAKCNPRNPRAIYFNEHAYVAVVLGGQVEMVGVDPELGGIFYAFSKALPDVKPVVERSTQCFNCHAGNGSQRVPGFVVESVAPILSGASYEKYRHDEQGHQIPLSRRFGGWYVTSAKPFGETKANILARNTGNGIEIVRVNPDEMWDTTRHLLPTGDILPQLVHEHQIGFDNRAIQAAYLVRDSEAKGTQLSPADHARLDDKTRELVRYILFADEAKLPPGGLAGDPQFIRDFQRNKKPAAGGASLKDFDLRTRMFKHRCSYMLYTPQWQQLPAAIKTRVYAGLNAALAGADREFAYLGDEERETILAILRATLPDLPADWR